jgi:PAS domain S-box-containing protein
VQKPTYEELELKIRELQRQNKTPCQKDVEFCTVTDNVLPASEVQYKTLFETMAQGAFFQRSDGAVIDCNAAALEMFGMSKDQFMGKTSMDPDWHVLAENGSDLSGNQHPSMVALTSGQPVHDFLAAVFNPKKQDYVWLNINAVPQFKKGESKPYQVFVTLHDVTDLKRAERALSNSEKRFRTLMNLTPGGIYQTDGDGNCVYANEEWLRMAGMTFDEAKGEGWIKGIYSEDHERIRQGWYDMIKIKAKWQDEYRFIDKEGKVTWVYGLATPVYGDDNTITGYLGLNIDITERKQAEEALKVSEQKNKEAKTFLQLLLDTIPVRLFWKDLGLRYLGCNRLFAQDAGLPSSETLIGSDDYVLGWKEQAKQYRADDLAVIASGKPKLNYEEPQTTPEGRHITLLTSKVPIRDTNNEIIGLLGTYKDITQRKQIEAEREATIEFLRFTNNSRAIEELIHEATTFIKKRTGCEAIGIRLKKENDYPYYETRGFPEEFVLAENWLCSRDEAGCPVFDSGGNPVLECMCGNVISGRFDPAQPFFTAQGSFWSNCTTELLASTSAEHRQSRTRNRCNGEGYESVALIPLHLGAERLGLIQLNDRKKGQFNLETITLLERLAGYLAVALAKFRAEEKLQALKEDLEIIVEKRTLELQETQKQYLHAEKLSAIGMLSASIAHEFNNPLQSVTTILKGIEQYVPLEEKEAELVELALQECQRMKYLILTLQDFNQPSSGRKTLTDIHNSLDAIMLLQKSDFKNKQISVVQNYAKNLPQIMAVSDQIKQVFLNLLTNAADACHTCGGVITVSTWQENDRVAVAIKDTGVGIKPEVMEHIFQPFFTTKPEVKGTGLGLSVSYGIIKKHLGEFRIESEPGRGSTFTILLPIKAEVH